MSDADALVLGAGISGLAAARRLRRQGREVVLLEAGDRPGGTFSTLAAEGFLVELGPNTVRASPALAALAGDAGCAGELIGAAAAAKTRYILRRGRPVALPAAPPALLTTPLLSAAGKLRLLTEPWRRSATAGNGEETVAEFFHRRLGREALERLGDALVLGVYAGDPAELVLARAFPSLARMEREHGGLFAALRRRRRAAPPRLITHRHGLEAFAGRLAAGLDLRPGWTVEAVERRRELFEVRGRRGDESLTLAARRLISALPAAATARVLAPLGDTAPLASLPHAPVAVVALGYRRERVAHPLDGFGVLIPHGEGRRLLGCLFSSTLFPDRAPAGHVLLTAMVGGRRRAGLVDREDEELVALAREELAELLGVEGEPTLAAVRRWRPGIPQPTAAMARVEEAAAALEAAHPGLTVLGAWRRGVGVPDCARAGWESAA